MNIGQALGYQQPPPCAAKGADKAFQCHWLFPPRSKFLWFCGALSHQERVTMQDKDAKCALRSTQQNVRILSLNEIIIWIY